MILYLKVVFMIRPQVSIHIIQLDLSYSNFNNLIEKVVYWVAPLLEIPFHLKTNSKLNLYTGYMIIFFLDQVCLVGKELALKFFPYWILLNNLHHSSTPTKQTWSFFFRIWYGIYFMILFYDYLRFVVGCCLLLKCRVEYSVVRFVHQCVQDKGE